MKRSSGERFIVEFPLKTEVYQEHVLYKRFEIGRHMFNSLANITLKRYKEMIKTKKYRRFTDQLKTASDRDKKVIYKEIQLMRKEYRLTEYEFHKDIAPMQRHFKENIDAFTAQKIASQLWKAYEKLFFDNGQLIHFKRKDEMFSLEGKSNKTGIRFYEEDATLKWNGLVIRVVIDKKNNYEVEALQNKIAYCRIIQKYIKGKHKYYLQIVFKGKNPIKYNKDTGEIKNSIGQGDVGIDIGTSTVAVVGEQSAMLCELASKVKDIERKRRIVLRKMERSRRSMNPDNYNEDGTIKKQGNKKVVWKKSKRYIKLQGQLKEIYRKQAAVRKYQHECLANTILSMGDIFYVEEMNIAALSKRAKKTEISNKTGKYKRKKRFGKSVGKRAPAMLLTILDRKLHYYDKELIKINTWKAKASQYNHYTGEYKKKSLSQRWNVINGERVQRDLYSAYLIMNINEDLETFNNEECEKRFEKFLEMHNKEIERLTGFKNLSCMGI